MKILIVEDEKRLAQALCQLLKLENYEADHFDNGRDGEYALINGVYDLAILDVMLPYKNGFEIVKSAREKGIKIPVLMLTAKGELDDLVQGLDSGADDYLTKPFMTKELLARIRALLRRNGVSTEGVLNYGDIELNTNTAMLKCKDSTLSVRLSEKEYYLLEHLISNGGKIVTRDSLALKIWGYDNEAEYNNVEVYLSFTRKKLAFVKAKTEIKAIRGIGYELKYDNV